MEESKHIVILGAGDFPKSPEALAVLQNASYLCCCDSAAKDYIDKLSNGKLSNCKFPDVIVGDGDSLSQDFKDKYASIYHQVDEQDFNDLTKATRFVKDHFHTSHLQPSTFNLQLSTFNFQPSTFNLQLSTPLPIHYLGVTGKREDHTIANIGFVSYFKHALGVEPTIVTDYGTFTFHIGNATLNTFPRQQVSIFNLTCTHLQSRNLKWDSYAYQELWQGALNEALSDTIDFLADGQYIVFRTHAPKL